MSMFACVCVPSNAVFRPKGLAQDTNVSQAKQMSAYTAWSKQITQNYTKNVADGSRFG